MNEKDLTKQIVLLIRLSGGFIYQTHRPGQYAPVKGVSDLAGIWQGKPLYIEVKGPKAKTTPEQITFLANVEEKGAIAFIARCIEDVTEKLEIGVLF